MFVLKANCFKNTARTYPILIQNYKDIKLAENGLSTKYQGYNSLK